MSIAEIGNGFSTPIGSNESAADLASTAWDKISSPQLSNIQLSVSEPADLEVPQSDRIYQGSPYIVYGKSETNASEIVITFSANDPSSETSFSTRDTIQTAELSALSWSVPKMWARNRIASLELDEGASGTFHKDSIIALSVEYQVLSKYTSFLAYEGSGSDSVIWAGGPDTVPDYGTVSTLFDEMPREQPKLAMNTFLDFLSWENNLLSFHLEHAGLLTLEVYDLKGNLVMRLHDGFASAGLLQLQLGRGDLGRGKYLIKARMNSGVQFIPIAMH